MNLKGVSAPSIRTPLQLQIAISQYFEHIINANEIPPGQSELQVAYIIATGLDIHLENLGVNPSITKKQLKYCQQFLEPLYVCTVEYLSKNSGVIH